MLSALMEARERLEQVQELLARPQLCGAGQVVEELQRCTELLAAVEREWDPAVRPGTLPGMREELERWRRGLNRVALLVLGASALCEGWAVAAGVQAGYSAEGHAQPVQSEGTVTAQFG
ncbi:MAG: hypothetical protein HY821_09590 [Acidobacteria bacterium]|nr:hypothetical protein [Acidobacteriota bacterium]